MNTPTDAVARQVDSLGLEAARSSLTIRRVRFDAPWDWLAAGWRDMWSVPQISLAYGAICVLAGLLLLAGLTQFGLQSLILALAAGFLLLAPLMAVGFYEASRLLEQGERPDFAGVLTAAGRAKGQLGFFGAILAFAFYVWLQLAFLLFMLFLGTRGLPPASEFVPTLLFTPHGLGLLVSGTLVGGVVAAIIFTVSVVSVPLLMTQRVDVVTAMSVSRDAVLRNPDAMTLWAALIAGFTALGIATLFVGLIFVFPLVGHATWHAFRDLVLSED